MSERAAALQKKAELATSRRRESAVGLLNDAAGTARSKLEALLRVSQ